MLLVSGMPEKWVRFKNLNVHRIMKILLIKGKSNIKPIEMLQFSEKDKKFLRSLTKKGY